MPYTKLKNGTYKSPSGKIRTLKQIQAMHVNRPPKSNKKAKGKS